MHIRDIKSEFEKLEQMEGVNFAQTATATSYDRLLDIKSADISIQKGLSNLFSSGRGQKQRMENAKDWNAKLAFDECYKQGGPGNGGNQADLI